MQNNFIKEIELKPFIFNIKVVILKGDVYYSKYFYL